MQFLSVTNKTENRKIIIFTIALLLSEVVFWGFMVLTRGRYLTSYFINDIYDTSMDYYNMLANISDLKPYKFNSNYPALYFCILRVIYHMIPIFPNGDDGTFLRSLEYAQLGYIVLCIVLIYIWGLMTIKMCEKAGVISRVLALAIMLSGPFLFLIERGNSLLFAITGIIVFLNYYDNPQKWMRYLAYFSLSIAVGVKIYPVVFGILIISKKRWKEALHCIIIGSCIFFLPFFAFDGIKDIKTMIYGILLSGEIQQNVGTNYNYSLINIIKIVEDIFGVNIVLPNAIILVCVIIFCGLLYVTSDDLWRKILSLSMICIWIPKFSYTYTLLLLLPPLIIFLTTKMKRIDIVYGVLFLIMFAPIGLPQVNASSMDKFPLSYTTVLVNLSLILLNIIVLIDNLYAKNIIREGKR